jgi:O-antigen/teichoic acid export membrane protein
LISKYWGPANTGFYAKAYAILSLFAITIGDSVNRVFHREIAGMIIDKAPIEDFIIRVIKSIIEVIMVPFLVILLIGGELFSIVLGPRWEEAGIIGGILAPWLFFSIISHSIRPLYSLFNRQKVYTVVSLFFLASWTTIFLFCRHAHLTIYETLYIFCGFAAISYLGEISFLLNITKINYRPILTFLFIKLIQVSPLILLNVILRTLDGLNAYILIAVNGLFSLIYLYVFLHKDPFIRNLINIKTMTK